MCYFNNGIGFIATEKTGNHYMIGIIKKVKVIWIWTKKFKSWNRIIVHLNFERKRQVPKRNYLLGTYLLYYYYTYVIIIYVYDSTHMYANIIVIYLLIIYLCIWYIGIYIYTITITIYIYIYLCETCCRLIF